MLLGAYLLLGGPGVRDHHDEVLASLPLTGARLTARLLVFYVYTRHTRTGSDRSGRSVHRYTYGGAIMAKNKPADNQFIVGEKYLARVITARWASLPTVGPTEYGLTIQLKFSVLCTIPPVGNSTFCGCEAVIYIIVRMDASNPREININPTPRRFLNDLDISWCSYPNNGSLLSHNEIAIICEFGQCDPVNGYQSILK